MSDLSIKQWKHILLVEDDPWMAMSKVQDFKALGDGVKVSCVQDAGLALDLLNKHLNNEPSSRIDALVLKTWLPYGNGGKALKSFTDPDERKTGVRILSWLRKHEEENRVSSPLWVALCPSFADCNIKEILPEVSSNEFDRQIMDMPNGKGRVYQCPYDSLVLINDLACALGVQSLIPAELLPDRYFPNRGAKASAELAAPKP